jgi:hypothetical protein
LIFAASGGAFGGVTSSIEKTRITSPWAIPKNRNVCS